MAVKPNYIEVTAAIRKADIAAYCAMRGKFNAMPIQLGSQKYPEGSVQFVTFAGALNVSDGLYHGFYRFEAGAFSGAECAELTMLPGFNSNGEHSDGI